MTTTDAVRGRRAAAIVSLVGYVATLVLAVLLVADNLESLLVAWAAAVLGTALAWVAVTRTGTARWVALVVVIGLVVMALAALVTQAALRDVLVVVVVWVLSTLSAHHALRLDRTGLRAAPPPGVAAPAAQRAVLVMNPRSGGGKVGQHDLAAEAARRGIRGLMLGPGDDLETLARDAIASGADVIGMAGGDGSQALVAGIAAEHGIPFVCIPAGTRNHLALDLGVDRDDVVGSLEAFVDGYERTIDLATVNGRTFVNNVSFGVYARIVQSDDYRDQKVATAAAMLPQLLGPDAEAFDLSVAGDGAPSLEHPCLVLVSNNRYELRRLGGFGSRARLDDGVLGIVALTVSGAADVAALVAAETAGQVSRVRGWHEWEATAVEISSSDVVAAGVDGEALALTSPVRLEIKPGALRVRVARSAPGLSPAHTRRLADPRALVWIALGRDHADERA